MTRTSAAGIGSGLLSGFQRSQNNTTPSIPTIFRSSRQASLHGGFGSRRPRLSSYDRQIADFGSCHPNGPGRSTGKWRICGGVWIAFSIIKVVSRCLFSSAEPQRQPGRNHPLGMVVYFDFHFSFQQAAAHLYGGLFGLRNSHASHRSGRDARGPPPWTFWFRGRASCTMTVRGTEYKEDRITAHRPTRVSGMLWSRGNKVSFRPNKKSKLDMTPGARWLVHLHINSLLT